MCQYSRKISEIGFHVEDAQCDIGYRKLILLRFFVAQVIYYLVLSVIKWVLIATMNDITVVVIPQLTFKDLTGMIIGSYFGEN